MQLTKLKKPPGGDFSPTIAVCGDPILNSVAHGVVDEDVGQNFVVHGILGVDRDQYRICK